MNLNLGEDHLHHSDGRHRWTGGPTHMPIEQWHEIVRRHLAEHRANPAGVGDVPRRSPPAIGWPVAPKRLGGTPLMMRRHRIEVREQ